MLDQLTLAQLAHGITIRSYNAFAYQDLMMGSHLVGDFTLELKKRIVISVQKRGLAAGSERADVRTSPQWPARPKSEAATRNAPR